MRYVFGFMCALVLSVIPLVGGGEEGGGADVCADWAGDWAVSVISCDGVVQPGFDSGVDLRFAANCTGGPIHKSLRTAGSCTRCRR